MSLRRGVSNHKNSPSQIIVPSALDNQPHILHPCKFHRSLNVRGLCRINHIIRKLLQVAGVFGVWQTSIILPVRLVYTDRVFGVEVRDAVLGSDIGTGSVVEY